ncbi:2-amino-4-hydroxy-6-hydroxymethyldihydropteridine diphosphokinase [Calidifontibacillus erzurumensis]|uniref:2-amino-4-hydroxy-6- hydroxymethyldihydropteridine diphosphokinase n=1 Tax=Calidifontibacillus erzurumensis TaxID=2741433 RepID=UPI0035B5663A
MNNIAFIGLGTNEGNREKFLKEAIQMLAAHRCISIVDYSSIYETEPVGYTEQPLFLNMVVKIATSLTALELLDSIQKIENDLGRKRNIRWGPRTIDLDILLYNKENIKSERLIVPHPRMFERSFVVIPLLEIDKDLFGSFNINIDHLKNDPGVSLYIDREKALQL